jgi:hypothetical protein
MATRPTKSSAVRDRDSKRSKRQKLQLSRTGDGDLGEVIMRNDDLDEIKKQLVRSGRTSGERLTVRINGG